MLTSSGQDFTEEQEMEIRVNWIERYCGLWDSCDVMRSQGDEDAPPPPVPLKVLPETTHSCITKFYCYHREYMTSDASQSKCQWISPLTRIQNLSVFSN
jgi:hypothetical protein